MTSYTKSWLSNCASSLCTLPGDPELQKGYRKVLMNENINWRKHITCSAHWSSGKRENKNHWPFLCVLRATFCGYRERGGIWWKKCLSSYFVQRYLIVSKFYLQKRRKNLGKVHLI